MGAEEVVKKNDLSPDKYLSDAALGMTLSRELRAAAAAIADDEEAKTVFFNDIEDGEDSYGYEVTCGGQHIQIDSGYELLTDAIAAFIDWRDRNLDDDDEEED